MVSTEIVLPFCSIQGIPGLCIKYISYGNSEDDNFCSYLSIINRVYSEGKYPLEMDIDVVTAVGLNELSADSVTVEKNTTLWV